MAKPLRKLRGNQELHLEGPSATIYNHLLCFETLPSWCVPGICGLMSSRMRWFLLIFFRNDLVLRLEELQEHLLAHSSAYQPLFQDIRVTTTLTREYWKCRRLGRGDSGSKMLASKHEHLSSDPWYPHQKPDVPTLLALGGRRQEPSLLFARNSLVS